MFISFLSRQNSLPIYDHHFPLIHWYFWLSPSFPVSCTISLCLVYSSTLEMEAVGSSETLVLIYHINTASHLTRPIFITTMRTSNLRMRKLCVRYDHSGNVEACNSGTGYMEGNWPWHARTTHKYPGCKLVRYGATTVKRESYQHCLPTAVVLSTKAMLRLQLWSARVIEAS